MPTTIILPPPPHAPSLLKADAAEKQLYWDRSHYDSPEAQIRALALSSSLYIGNLSFSTRVAHLKALFSTVGPVKSIHMGKDRFQKTPCGFAFVEYNARNDALDAVAFLSGSKLDGKVIRVELDAGFKPGRQYGRGASGGQVRDDRRGANDPKRRTSRGRDSAGGAGAGVGAGTGDNMASRWEAPPSAASNNGNSNGGPISGHYGPARTSGEKRGRDDYDQYDGGRAAKNSRFEDE
jgi:nuclear cap-binding protein subunit 2